LGSRLALSVPVRPLKEMNEKVLRKLVALALVLTVAAVVAVTAATARAGMAIGLGTPDLQAGVLIAVPVTVSCSPFDPALTMASSSISVSVEQAVTKTEIAHGFALLPVMGGMGGNPILYACDDSPHTFTLDVLADISGPPFKKGQAAFSASAQASAGTPCGPGCFFNLVSQSASRTQVLRMK
jgi:hypothetical protein